MRLLMTFAALVAGSALAAGSSTELATGQLWELTFTSKDGLSTRTSVRLTNPVPPAPDAGDAPGVQFYNLEDLFSGGWLVLVPSQGQLDATLMGINSLQCFTSWQAGAAVSKGYFLRGTVDSNRQLLTAAAQRATTLEPPSRAQVLDSLKPLSNGTCTIKRLR